VSNEASGPKSEYVDATVRYELQFVGVVWGRLPIVTESKLKFGLGEFASEIFSLAQPQSLEDVSLCKTSHAPASVICLRPFHDDLYTWQG
jgi:hypothetical protein